MPGMDRRNAMDVAMLRADFADDDVIEVATACLHITYRDPIALGSVVTQGAVNGR
jgi:hypothetical protein